MILISHRGNIDGPIPIQENHPTYIDIAIQKGYHVEIDIWIIDNDQIFLGHDEPQYLIDISFLNKNKDVLLCHAKNLSAMEFLVQYGYHCFSHDTDPYIYTNKGDIIAHPKSKLSSNTICMMPELCDKNKYCVADIFKAKGICSDYINSYKILMKPLQIVIPMAGLGSRFTSFGFKTNKYMLPISSKNGNLMIEEAIASLKINIPCKYFFIIRKDQDENSVLSNYLKQLCLDMDLPFQIIHIDHLTEGPASTTYQCVPFLDLAAPLIVSNSDQVLDWSFDTFMQTCIKYDGCVLCYKPDYKLEIGAIDKNSYARLDEKGIPVEFKEKEVISEYALVGVHYFKQAKLFVDSYQFMEANNIRAPNGEFYLSICYDILVKQCKRIGIHSLEPTKEKFYPVGEPLDYFTYLYTKGNYLPLIVSPSHNNKTIIENDKLSCILKHIDASEKYYVNAGLYIIIQSDNIETPIIRIVSTETVWTFPKAVDILVFKHINMDYEKIVGSYDISEYIRGWFVGDFEPSIFKTKDIEIAYMSHKERDKWPFHYHMKAYEYNILISGNMILNSFDIKQGAHFLLRPNEIACPEFITDCYVLCIKYPSVIGDKYII